MFREVYEKTTVKTAYVVTIAITVLSLYCPVTSVSGTTFFSSFFGVLEIAWPLGLGTGILLMIWWLEQNTNSIEKHIHIVVGWMLGGLVLMVGVTLLLIMHQESVGVEIYRSGVVISDMGIAGAAFGALVGWAQVITNDAKEELRSYKKAVENAGHCIYFTDTEGNIEWVNRTFEKRTGYCAKDVIGEPASILNSGEHDEELFQELWRTISSGDVWDGELINETQNGEHVHVDQTIAPVFDETNGEIERYVAINSDITQIKEYEQQLEQLNEQLSALNRVLRHDIRNDMAVIKGWGEILLTAEDDDKIDDAVGKIVRSSEHVIELTEVAKEFIDSVTESGEANTKPTDLNHTLQQVVDTRSESFTEAEITIENNFPDVTVSANEMLSSVFRNLVNNAVQHNDKETPHVHISVQDIGESVEVRVADNGPGVADTEKDEIFSQAQKGFDSDGTGMGLYLVNKWVKDFDGDVWVEDNEPTGAVFVVELPKQEN